MDVLNIEILNIYKNTIFKNMNLYEIILIKLKQNIYLFIKE